MNGAIARIILRYVVGAVIMGSHQIGEQLATDPDLVMAVGGLVGLGIEVTYALAKRKGWSL